MATRRNIDSPGIQISEVDLSLRPVQTTSTTIFIPGFSPRGPINTPLTVASLSEFETTYGQPTNGAERYFYNSVKAALQSPANVLVSRLPYGSGGATTNSLVSLLAYPASYVDTSVVNNTNTNSLTNSTLLTAQSAQLFTQSTSGTFVLGAPVHYTLTTSQWNDFQNGSLFSYQQTCSGSLTQDLSSLGYAALIIANPPTSNINSLYEGYYVGIVDNSNLNAATNYDSINYIKSLNTSATYISGTSYATIPSQRYGFPLSANSTDGSAENSLSQILETIVSYDTYSNRSYDDTLVIGLFKLQQSVFSSSSVQLGFNLQEGYMGSFDSKRLINPSNGGPAQSFFIENQVNTKSSNLLVKVNPYLSRVKTGSTYLQLDGTPAIKIRASNPTMNNNGLFAPSLNTSASANQLQMLGFTAPNVNTYLNNTLGTTDAIFPLGSYLISNQDLKAIGNVPAKLQTVLNIMLNPDIYPINIACEAGLGTVYAVSQRLSSTGGTNIFDDYAYVNTQDLSAFNGTPYTNDLVLNYQAVASTLQSFIENDARKDMIGILDPLTPILVQANSIKTVNDPDLTNFSTNVLWPLKNQFAPFNSSYLCTYPTVVRVTDITTGAPVWVPFSGFAAALMANTDVNYQPWYAPAGFNRGILSMVSDIAYYPRQKQRDQLYTSNFNPVAFFPSDGFVVYGQKTLQKTPSAFDRINVRRLFLALEISTRNTLKYYVFEPNTLFTRTQVVNTLTPIFENAKNTQGVYDYLIICDERNNTPTVIDDNTMIVDIYIKPVRTAEFILANFYATATSVNFQEIMA